MTELQDRASPLADHTRPTLAFRVGTSGPRRFLVLLHTASEPDVQEWRRYVQQVSIELALSKGLVHTFVATDGGGPNAAQRKELAAAIHAGAGDLLTHVFTSDRLVRGIVTAFRWLARAGAVAHLPSEFIAVCPDCGVRSEDVRAAFFELQGSFPRVQTLSNMLSLVRPARASFRRQ